MTEEVSCHTSLRDGQLVHPAVDPQYVSSLPLSSRLPYVVLHLFTHPYRQTEYDAEIERMVSVTHASPVAGFVSRHDCSLVYANDAFCSEIGFPRERLVGTRWYDHVDADEHPGLAMLMAHMAQRPDLLSCNSVCSLRVRNGTGPNAMIVSVPYLLCSRILRDSRTGKLVAMCSMALRMTHGYDHKGVVFTEPPVLQHSLEKFRKV